MASDFLFAIFFALSTINVSLANTQWATDPEEGPSRLQRLFKAETTDPAEGTSEIYLELDEQFDVKQIMRRDWEIDPKTQRPYEEVEYYSLEQLKKGIILKQSSGLAVISLKGGNIEAHQGGTIQITYLSNGIKKSYKTEEFSVGRLGDEWQSYSPGNEVFRSMIFVIKEFLGKKIGIKEIKYQTES